MESHSKVGRDVVSRATGATLVPKDHSCVNRRAT